MSTPTDNWANTAARRRHDASRGPLPLVAGLVLRELLESDSALTETDLHERTLLPEAEVREAIDELEARGLCTPQNRRPDGRPRQYAASFPSEQES